MRSIDASLLTAQKTLGGRPARSLVIGTSPNTIDVSAYLLSYDYQEIGSSEGGLVITLDNKDGYFNTLTGSKTYITQGATIELKRGMNISGADVLEELPRTWIESLGYDQAGGASRFILTCIDWRGKLARWRTSSAQSWSATSATTILEWLLTQVGLTRESGAMTALTLDFELRLEENGGAGLKRLVSKMPEYLHSGLDAEVKWREIDGGDSSQYTFGWNAEHPGLSIATSTGAWEVNSIAVKGKGSKTGSASDATQIAKVGTRHWTIWDESLASNAYCAQRAQAELDLYEAEAVEAVIVCRPCHGLELYDVVTFDSPPWGGSNVVGRVIRYREEWNHDGRWSQTIGLGAAVDKDPGNQPAKKKRSTGRRRSRKRRRRRPPSRTLPIAQPWHVPIGGIILWPGAIEDIPAGYVLCDGENDTYDLRGVFIPGAGGAYTVGDTGGEDESDLGHGHTSGSFATDWDSHNHTSGSFSTNEDTHDHALLSTPENVQAGTGYAATTHSDTHSHDVTGTSSNDNHNHNVTGTSANGGAAAQENRPAFCAIHYIMRIE